MVQKTFIINEQSLLIAPTLSCFFGHGYTVKIYSWCRDHSLKSTVHNFQYILSNFNAKVFLIISQQFEINAMHSLKAIPNNEIITAFKSGKGVGNVLFN